MYLGPVAGFLSRIEPILARPGGRETILGMIEGQGERIPGEKTTSKILSVDM